MDATVEYFPSDFSCFSGPVMVSPQNGTERREREVERSFAAASCLSNEAPGNDVGRPRPIDHETNGGRT